MKGRAIGSSDDADDTSGPYLSSALGDASPSRPPCIDRVDTARLNADATARSSKQSPRVRPSSARSRRPASSNWKQGDLTQSPNVPPAHTPPPDSTRAPLPLLHVDNMTHSARESEDAVHNTSAIAEANKALPLRLSSRCHSSRGPWSVTGLAIAVTMIGMAVLGAILNSSWNLQLDQKGCRMSYMRPSYIHLRDFDTEHTRFATKYSLHLYREQGFDDGRTVSLDIDDDLYASFCILTPILSPASSKVSRFFSYPATPVVTGRCGPSPPRPLDTITSTWHQKQATRRRIFGTWTFSQWTSTRTLLRSTDKLCSTKLNI